MLPHDFIFAFTEAGWLFFLCLIWALLFWRLYHYRQDIKERYFSKNPQVFLQRSPFIYAVKTSFICLAWIFLVIALMQPKGAARYAQASLTPEIKKIVEQQSSTRHKRKAHEVILLIDVSSSMGVKDAFGSMTRLDAAKETAEEVIKRFNGESLSVYAFTSHLDRVVPETVDYLFSRLMIKGLELNEGGYAGTDLKDVFNELFGNDIKAQGQKLYSLVILSDGGDTAYESALGKNKMQRVEEILSEIPNAQELNLRSVVIGIGSTKEHIIPGVTYRGHRVESMLQSTLLEQIAKKARGRMIFANTSSPLTIAKDTHSVLMQDNPYLDMSLQTSLPPPSFLVYDLYFQIPLGVALMLLILEVILPNVRRPNVRRRDEND